MNLFLILLLACWGSFLNFLAYRLVHDISFGKLRSVCPKCFYQISWFDLIPIVAWFNLRGKCRNCNLSISKLYPFIEISTIIAFLALYFTTSETYYFAYFIFFSALLITIRTDLETMLISRFTTLFLIPIAFIFSLIYFKNKQLLPITILESILGALFGYLILYIINKIFFVITKKNGIGQGDMDLLAMIGSFTGIIGAWISLMIGSIFGSVIGILILYLSKFKKNTKIPFGPFLAIGAMIYTLFQNEIQFFLFY